MKVSIRPFKYGDAWLAELDGSTAWLEIPAIANETAADTNRRAIEAMEKLSAGHHPTG